MKHVLINASPRGTSSNSRVLLEQLAIGIANESSLSGEAPELEIRDLRKERRFEGLSSALIESDILCIAFPLYADFVPGILKEWLEDLGRDALKGKKLLWIIHCGFPDSIHLELCERYLIKVTGRLGAQQLGIVKKAGSEGIRLMPAKMNAKLFSSLHEIGKSIATGGKPDPNTIKRLARPRKLGRLTILIMRMVLPLGILNIYWIGRLRAHGAFSRRFDRPYAD